MTITIMDTNIIMLNVSDIIDSGSQRRLSERRVREIAENWDFDLYDPITVNKRSKNVYACVDGQHRLEAAVMAGIKMLAARVICVPEVEEAKYYNLSNETRKKQTPYHTFLNRTTYDSDAMNILNALNQAGVELVQSASKWNDCASIGTIYRMKKRCNGRFFNVLKLTLNCIAIAWKDRLGAYSSAAIDSIFSFLSAAMLKDDFSYDRFCDKLSKISPNELWSKYSGNNRQANAKIFLLDMYNRGKSKNLLVI